MAADRGDMAESDADGDGDEVASHYLDSFPDVEADLLVRLVDDHASTVADIEKARALVEKYSRVPRGPGMISLIRCNDPEEDGAHAGASSHQSNL